MRKSIKILPMVLIVSILISFFPSGIFAATLRIVAIKDLNTSVYVNQSYSLPTTVDAIMSNKTTLKVAVTWSPKTVVTLKTGTFVFNGKVKGYAKQVLFTLKVTAAPVADLPEIMSAVNLGFVPKELQGDYNTTITYKQYCQMLTNMITKYDSSYLPSWKKLAAAASQSNDKMLKEDGILAMSYVAVLMGTNTIDWRIDKGLGISQQEMDKQIDKLSWNYKYFPDWSKIVYGDCNYMWGGVTFLAQKRSLVSSKTIYPYDYKNHTMHLDEPLTRHDAILAVLRFYESQHRDVNASDAKNGTVSAQAIALAAKMPQVSSTSHPSWHGIPLYFSGLPDSDDKAFATKDNISEIAGMGFNFIRLILRYEDFTDYKNGTMVFRQDVLENFDRIVEWCTEYKIHVSIDMHELPGYSSAYPADKKNILENHTNYQNALLIYSVLSARYASVPSNLISYNLINEPDRYFTKESYAAFAKDIVSVIRSNDKTNKLLVSDGMIFDGGWGWDDGPSSEPDQLLDNSIMQSIHLYPYCGRSVSGYLNLEKWPYEHLPAVKNIVNSGTSFDIKGDFKAGTVVTLDIDNVFGINSGGTIECTADGNKIASYPLNNFQVGKNNCTNIQDNRAEFGGNGKTNAWTLKFTVSTDCKKISISPLGGSSISINVLFLRLPSDTAHIYGVPDSTKINGFVYETGKFTTVFINTAGSFDNTKSSAITINPDGSHTVENEAAKDMFDYESLRAFIKKWADWSKSTGTPIMCNEFGVPVSLSGKARVEYMKSVLDLFKEYNISWCLYSDRGPTWSPIVADSTVKRGETILPVDSSLSLKNGFWYDAPMLNLFREYMK